MHMAVQIKMVIMMNHLAFLSLLVTSLVAAAVWSLPTNQPREKEENVLIKEGHRVVVVQYDEDGEHNTKVSIKEATGQGISPEGHRGTGARRHSQGAGELICDAFGKCTHIIATAFGKARHKVSDTAQDTTDKVSETAHEIKDKVSETEDRVAETAQKTKGAIGDALGKAKERVVEKGKDTIDNAKASAHTFKGDVVTDVAENLETAKQKAMEGATVAKDNTQRAADKAKTGSNKFINGLKYMASMKALNSVMGMANLIGLATAYGMSLWVTFISSYVLAAVLPRQQFGVVQSRLYPVYFRAMAYSIGLALLGHCLGERKKLFTSKLDMFQAFNLLSSLLMVLVNAHYLEPRATKVMFERMKMEKEEGRGRDDLVAEGCRVTEPPRTGEDTPPLATATTRGSKQEVLRSRMAKLNERLKKLNANSSLLNVLTLMALTGHLVYVVQRLGVSC